VTEYVSFGIATVKVLAEGAAPEAQAAWKTTAALLTSAVNEDVFPGKVKS
jgi:hypothetical protein